MEFKRHFFPDFLILLRKSSSRNLSLVRKWNEQRLHEISLLDFFEHFSILTKNAFSSYSSSHLRPTLVLSHLILLLVFSHRSGLSHPASFSVILEFPSGWHSSNAQSYGYNPLQVFDARVSLDEFHHIRAVSVTAIHLIPCDILFPARWYFSLLPNVFSECFPFNRVVFIRSIFLFPVYLQNRRWRYGVHHTT